MKTDRLHTLRSISADCQVSYRAVQGWYAKACESSGLPELGELKDGARHFTDEEKNLIASFGSDRARKPQPQTPQITIESGSSQLTLATPELPESYSLETLRQSQPVLFDDPLAVAEQFLEIASQIQQAMDADIETREVKLNQTRRAKQTIAEKASELKLEQRLYRERTRQIDSSQTEETQALSSALQLLQTLGKPQSAG